MLFRYEADKAQNRSASLEVQEGTYEDFIWSEVAGEIEKLRLDLNTNPSQEVGKR
jgi:hypothetical protein